MKKAFNFRAVLVCVLVLVMCLTAFVACDKKEDQYDMSSLENAKSYLKSIYKELGPTTPSNFDLVVKVPGAKAGVFHDIEWTVTVLTEGEETSITVVPGTDKVTIQVPEKASQDINYTLTATIKDGDHNVKLEYNLTVPKWRELTWAEYMSKKTNEAVIVKGKVTSISSKSTGDKYNCMYIYDNDGGYYIYSLTEDPLTTYPNLAIGMTVQVTGTKDIYNGTHEVKNATFTVINDSTTIEFADITDIFAAAADMKDENLTKKAYMPVEIKNVIIGDIDTASSYYYFSIGATKSYLRVSSSDNMLSDEETKAFKDGFAKLNGKYATVKGMATVYNGAFYIQVITTDAAVEQEAPERDPAGQIADVKGRLAIDTAISGSGRTFTLPTQDTVYTDVKIAWAASSEIAKIENGKVTYTFAEDGTVKLTATLTHATDTTVSDTKEFTVTLSLGTEITIADLYKAKKGDTVYIVTGYVVAAGGDHNTAGSFVIADATGSIFSYNKAKVEVGDYVQVIGTRDEQYSLAQLATISVKQLTGGAFVEATPEEISVADVKVDGSTLYTGQFYKIVGGTLKVVVDGSKTYINLMNGETRMVSLYGDVLVDTMKALDGKEVVVYGYSRGVNTNQKYWQLQVTRIETNEPVKSDAEKVAEAKEALTLDVTSTGVSFKLPLVGENGATISWTSSNTDVIAINGEDAVVTAPAADTLVKLTATIKIGEAQDTKEFDVTITATIPEFDVTITQPAAGGTVEVKNGADVIATGKFQQGTVLTITATPQDAQHELVAIKVNGKAIEAVDGVYSVNVTEAVEITAEFKEIKNVTVTIAAVENGKVEVKKGADAVENNAVLRDGDVLTITATANAGYKVSAIKVNGEAIKGNTYTITGAEADGKVAITVETVEYTQADIVNDAWALEENTPLGTFTLTGVIKSIDTPYDSGFGNLTVSIIVDGLTEKPMICFRMKGTGAESLMVNDTITVTGTIKNYNGKVEFDSGCTFKDRVVGTSTVSVDANSSKNATVTLEDGMTSGLNGATFTFTVSVSDGHELVSVKVNGVEVNAVENIYTGTINGNTIVSVETKEVGAADPVVVATFEFPTSGKTGHQDGSPATSYTDTNNSYTLSITDGSNFYTKANDAKGNGCLKLGTGKKTGSFTLTAPENVKFVVLYVAGYKANTASITINGTKYDVSTASNNGEYTAIKVAVPENKTIAFESGASGDKRCMINKIEFMA